MLVLPRRGASRWCDGTFVLVIRLPNPTLLIVFSCILQCASALSEQLRGRHHLELQSVKRDVDGEVVLAESDSESSALIVNGASQNPFTDDPWSSDISQSRAKTLLEFCEGAAPVPDTCGNTFGECACRLAEEPLAAPYESNFLFVIADMPCAFQRSSTAEECDACSKKWRGRAIGTVHSDFCGDTSACSSIASTTDEKESLKCVLKRSGHQVKGRGVIFS